MINAPETITLRLLKPEETTAPGDRMLCGDHLYPVSLHDVPVSEYAVAVYREVPQSNEQEHAA